MPVLDLATVQFMGVAACLASALYVGAIWQEDRHNSKGFLYLAAHFAVRAVGLALAAAGGDSLRGWAELTGLAAWVLLYVGAHRFTQAKHPSNKDFLILGLGLAALAGPALAVGSRHGQAALLAGAALFLIAQIARLFVGRSLASPGAHAPEAVVALLGFAGVTAAELAADVLALAPQVAATSLDLLRPWWMGGQVILVALLTQSLSLAVKRRLLDAVQGEREKFAGAFQAAPFAITLSRREDRKIVDVNSIFAEQTGLSRADVIDKSVDQLTIWDDPAVAERIGQELSRTGQAGPTEVVFRKKGTISVGLLSARTFQAGGETFAMACVADITAQKQNEQQLRNTQAAREVEREANRVADELQRRQMVDLLDDALAARKQAEEGHKLQLFYSRRAEALLAFPAAAERMSEMDFMRFGVDQTEALTNSRIAFIHLMHEDQQNIELVTWSSATQVEHSKVIRESHYPLSAAGVWADAAREQKPIVINDYEGANQAGALPEGHAELQRLLTVPVVDGGKVRLLLGVGNKPEPYGDLDVETAKLLADALWRVVRQRRDDATLQEQRQLLAEAQTAAQIGSWSIEVTTNEVHWSDQTFALYGRDPCEGQPSVRECYAQIHPDDRAAVAASVAACVQGGPPAYQEFRTDPARGPVRWLLGKGALVRGEQGQPLRISGTVQDITDAQAARAKIEQLSRLYATLSGCSRAIMRSTSETELFQRVCEDLVNIGGMATAWLARTGADGQTLVTVGRAGRDRDVVDGLGITMNPDLPGGQVPCARAIRDKTPFWCQDFQHDPATAACRERRPDIRWQSMAALPLVCDGEAVAGLSVLSDSPAAFDPEIQELLLDLTLELSHALDRLAGQRERAEHEEQLRKLSQAVEQSSEAIVITDLQARIEYVNAAFERITGYRRTEVLGANPRLLQSGKTPPITYKAMWRALSEGRGWKGEFLNRRKDGSEFSAFSIISPLRQADGKVGHFVSVTEDITDRKRVGAELDAYRHRLEDLVASRTADLEGARQQSEAANRAKTAFLANMSHEIRTPMNAILGLTHLLQRNNPTAEQRERLNRIDDSGRHLLSIINDILDLSKIESGHFALEVADFPLSAVLDRVASIVAEGAQAKELSLSVDRDGVPPWLRGDATRLRQALLNYAGNAVKFSEHGGVALRAKLVEQEGDHVLLRFEVEDTGIGIAPEHQARLFQSFEQADVSTTRKFGGTGLGLAITRRIAAAMGGEAGMTSELGVGSTFWFTCRLQVGEPASQAESIPDGLSEVEAAMRELYRSARLLLVEDHPVNREVAVSLLRGAGLSVDEAEDGIEAVKMAQATAYDLILMDVQMPNMNGLDATRAIHALPGRQATPIVAMTANAFDEDRRRCEAAGMCDFVAKPVEPEALFAALVRWLRARHRSDERRPTVTPAPMHVDHVKTPLPQPLAKAAGLDTHRGLVAVSGDGEAYTAILRQFTVAHTNDCRQLRAEIGAGDYPAALRRVHTLKGVSGTLGAVHIHQAAVALESALRDGDAEWLTALLDDLSDAIEALSNAVNQVPGEPPPAPMRGDRAKGELVLRQMEVLLAGDDTMASDVYVANRPMLMATYGSQVQQLGTKLAAFDFPAALVVVRELLSADVV